MSFLLYSDAFYLGHDRVALIKPLSSEVTTHLVESWLGLLYDPGARHLSVQPLFMSAYHGGLKNGDQKDCDNFPVLKLLRCSFNASCGTCSGVEASKQAFS